MAVAGQRIAAVCEDNTINVYDAVTGVLRLTLKAPQRVTNVAGSPDGSILFCAHQQFHEITLWDMQTGGLIHTFTMKSEISDIAVSLTGRYLASCSPDGTFEFWDVESRCEGSHFRDDWVGCACWLEPEDHVALGLRKTVVVLEITTGRMLHTFPVDAGRALHTIPVEECVGEIAYSAGQHRLAVCLTSITESTIVVIDIQTGSTSVSSPLADAISFTFSGNGDRVVCASGTNDLQFFDTTTPTPRWHKYPSHPGLIDSISLLKSGDLAVNVGDSIQLLAAEYAQPSGNSLDLEVSHIHPLDNGRAISASSRGLTIVDLLDMETMETLADYNAGPDGREPWHIICASVDRCITILASKFSLKMEVTGCDPPKWELILPHLALLGALSPDGEKFIIVAKESVGWKLCVRRVLDGKILGSTLQGDGVPKDAGFTSDTRFYVDYEVKDDVEGALALAAASVSSEARLPTKPRHAVRPLRITFGLIPATNGFDIWELGRRISPAPPYGLDENLEWVVDAGSRRVCWLPPGYISGIEDGHFFVGSSLVMAGEDGILRKLTFKEPCSDS
jgi:WD40 repeat protein